MKVLFIGAALIHLLLLAWTLFVGGIALTLVPFSLACLLCAAFSLVGVVLPHRVFEGALFMMAGQILLWAGIVYAANNWPGGGDGAMGWWIVAVLGAALSSILSAIAVVACLIKRVRRPAR